MLLSNIAAENCELNEFWEMGFWPETLLVFPTGEILVSFAAVIWVVTKVTQHSHV